MLKKSLFWKVLGTLLILFLIFSACSTGTGGSTKLTDTGDGTGDGDGGGGNQSNPKTVDLSTNTSYNATQLNNDLSSTSTYTEVILKADSYITRQLDGPLTISTNKTLRLESVGLIVPASKTATIAGNVDVYTNGKFLLSQGTCENTGTITVYRSGEFLLNQGSFTNKGNIDVNASGLLSLTNGIFTNLSGGTLTVNSGGEFVLDTVSGTNEGRIIIKSGATTRSKNGSSLVGSGLTVVERGGKAYLYPGGTETLYVGAEAAAVFQIVSGTFSFNNTKFVLDGTGNANGRSGGYEISSTQHLEITPGSVLTVPAGSTLGISTRSSSSPHGIIEAPDVSGTTRAR
ncbi:hypothetical protein LQZ21_07455, partial [Treponema sp. TIM-1]|uniref:hypothetical protein n=1 Tax=Treponema sp. TIM-1 TaxID=2898417 RepID=UPI00397EEC4B